MHVHEQFRVLAAHVVVGRLASVSAECAPCEHALPVVASGGGVTPHPCLALCAEVRQPLRQAEGVASDQEKLDAVDHPVGDLYR